MARVSVATTPITRDGIALALGVPTADGDAIDCGRTALYASNTGVSSVNVTVISTPTVDGLDVEDLVVAIPAGEVRIVGPFPQRTFGQPAGAVETGNNDQGRAYVNYSTPADISRMVVSL